MKKLLLFVTLWLLLSTFGVAQTQSAFRFHSGAALPATCRVADVFYKTAATAGLYNCTSANTWTLAAGTAAAITGSGSASQIALWSGATTLIGDSGILYDAASDSIGLGASAYRLQVSGAARSTVFMGVTPTTLVSGDLVFYGLSLVAVTGNVEAFHGEFTATTGVSSLVYNTNTTGGSANAVMEARTGGASGGDAFSLYTINGVTNWSAGIDNSDSDKYKIDAGSAPGSASVIVLTTAGAVQFATGYGVGTITSDASGNLTSVSDARLKNVQGQFTRGLEAVLQLQPVNYRWRPESGLETAHTYTGFLAQDVGRVIPEAVGQNNQGYYSFSDRAVIAALVNAVKELNARIAVLEKKK